MIKSLFSTTGLSASSLTWVDMENWLQQFLQMLPVGSLYLLLLCLIAFVEALPVFNLVVPGSTIAVFAGYLVLHGKGSLLVLILVHMAGSFLGDLASFWLGFYFGSRLLKLRSFQKRQRLFQLSERFFLDHGGKSIFFARFIGPLRGFTPFIAGLSDMPRRSFIGYALFSAVLWGIAYPGLGFLGGSSWQQAQSMTTRFGIIVMALLVVTLLQHFMRRYIKRQGKS